MLAHWEPYALAVAGILGFVLQQVSLGTGRLAPLGRHRLGREPDRERDPRRAAARRAPRAARLARRGRAFIGLGLALAGAVAISLAHETRKDEATAPEPGEPSVAVA